jgi:glycosyltransferase involved in cell wall biosynthesis
MTNAEKIRNSLRELKCCVVVPTYNNVATLPAVLKELRLFCEDIIVVDDGSDDGTGNLLAAETGITLITMPVNKGKGYAVRAAFRKSVDMGFDYLITIDSDGQHSVSDLGQFVMKIRENPGALIIGERNMKQASVPGKSSFGHRFSNFWFRVETGQKLRDTQSGYRLYPVKRMKKMRWVTRRYEFEIEVLVRAAWKGIPILHVPVSVYYAPKEKRISHFRPFIDFTRVSLLNTVLVFIALLFVRPFLFARGLNKKNIKAFFERELWKSQDSDRKIILSVMLGLFLGVMPVWGWQMAVALLFAVLFRLNKVITLVASNISIPPMIPFIIWGSYASGGLVYKHHSIELEYSSGISLMNIGDNLLQYITGSFIFGAMLAVAGGIIMFAVLKIFRKKRVRNNPPEEGVQA